MTDSHLIRLGTSSWTAKGWETAFYPTGLDKTEWISHYATEFSTVEVDASFYRIPSEQTVINWKERAPEGFLFSAKAPKAITHDKLLTDCDAELNQFLNRMALLESRLGVLLFQFPYYSKKTGVTNEEFLERLRRFLPLLPKQDFRFAVEVRNKYWIQSPLLDLLADNEIALALIDHPWMYRPQELMKINGIVTAPFTYIRWLGDRYQIEELTTTWAQTVMDKGRQLQEWVEPVKTMKDRGVEVYGYFNNHYSGHAPSDVRKFQEMMGMNGK